MDADQFAAFLKVFTESQTTLATTLATITQQLQLQRPENQSNVSVSNIQPFENFDQKKEKFKNYLDRFENYLAIKNISDENKKAQILCASIGSLHYNNLSALIGPENPIKSLDFPTLVKSFSDMLSPHRNVVVSQHYFLSTYQKPNESIPEYVASLQKDLAECEFTVQCECTKTVPVSDLFLRAQFIRGLKDDWIREQLLQSDSTSFKDILTKATALEASRLETQVLNKHLISNTADVDINKLSNTAMSRFRSHSNSRIQRKYKSENSYSPKFRSKSKADYSRLGIEGACFRCGRNNHRASECRTSKSSLHCTSCSKQGHVAKVCISTQMRNKYSTKNFDSSSTKHVSSDDVSIGLNQITEVLPVNKHDVIDIFDNSQRSTMSVSEKYFATVQINGIPMRFEVDSGAGFTLIPEDDFKRLNLNQNLTPSNVYFRAYTNDIFRPKGKVSVEVTYKDRKSTEDMYIVPVGRPAILGRVWIRSLKISLQEIDKDSGTGNTNCFSVSTPSYSTDDLYSEFSSVFEQKIGCVPNHTVSLQLRDNANPVYTKERNVPYALRAKVEEELNSLETVGIISKVDASDWGSPLVVIPKGNNTVRLCVDYKTGVNNRIVSSNFPIKHIPDVLHSLRDSKFFCKLDIYKAYLHIPVDAASSKIQTITTHRGTYSMHRLSFGIKTAPAEFNRILSQILSGLPKTEVYFDDIVVHGATKDECLNNLRLCLARLQENDIHLNKDKCKFFCEKIEYLGHVIQHNKICKSPEKIRAVCEMPRPKNIDEVRKFLGMVTYYARFIPDLSTKTTPLRKLLQKNRKFNWTKHCQAAFECLKEEITSDRVLVPYNPHYPLVLTCDASPTGIAAVMSHMIDGEERPIAYASRSLTASECNYSQLDREALAIVFGVSHFHDYLYGLNFTLITDNAPLTRIFHESKSLPPMTSSRLLRYASFLSGFNYSIQFKKGESNSNVDCLSRAPVTQHCDTMDVFLNNETTTFHSETIFEISSENLNANILAQETEADKDLKEIKRKLLSSCTDLPYTLDNGVLFKENRAVIPKSLQPQVLKQLHATHIGITKMKQLARRYVYWQGIDKDIEHLVQSCENCAHVKFNPAKAPLHPWAIPEENWERIHIDYAGPFQNYYFLVCVCAKSKWVEVKVLRNAPSSTNTITLLDNIFSSHGYPQVMVSDNASIFTSAEFKSYCTSYGIFQKLIAPGHAATNGLAERTIQTLKQRLKAMESDSRPIQMKVQEILRKYRATPLSDGQSPAERYLHRKLRIELDALRPYHPLKNPPSQVCVRRFNVGERVLVRDYTANNKYIWSFGEITEKLGVLHYVVKLDSGRTLKRHLDQLRKTEVKRVRFETSEEDPEGNRSIIQIPHILRPLHQNHPSPDSSKAHPAPTPTSPRHHPVTPPNSPRHSLRNRRPPAYLREYQWKRS